MAGRASGHKNLKPSHLGDMDLMLESQHQLPQFVGKPVEEKEENEEEEEEEEEEEK